MKLKVLFIGMILILLALSTALPLLDVQAADDPPPTSTPQPTNTSVEVVNDYYSIIHTTTRDGISLQADVINGPPKPPDLVAWEASRVSVSSLDRTADYLSNFPSYDWVFGCSAVSGAMIAAYYDNNGYDNMYTGPANGGLMPLTDTSWSIWSDGFRTYPNNPLIASHDSVDGYSGHGSIDDYWYQINSSVDPYVENSWTQHSWGTAIGDYMKTSQYNIYNNIDGGTKFYNWSSSSSPLTCGLMESLYDNEVENYVNNLDGTYGRKLFYETRGYIVTDCYNQYIEERRPGGFTLAQFQAEIDAGNPVLINLQGHSIVGYGYNDSTIYIRDTWDNDPNSIHTMTWGGSYQYMPMLSVSIVHLENIPFQPDLFDKSSPEDGVLSFDLTPTLEWEASARADTYEYCVNTSESCNDWVPVGAATSVTLPELDGGIQYYWQVRAKNETGTIIEANSGDMWSFNIFDFSSLTEKVFVPLVIK